MKKLLLLTLILNLLFFQCKKQDNPCDNLICQHGGTCINGTCECPLGWTGDLCQTQMQPVELRITKITVTQFPDGNFDALSHADMYVAISEGTNIDNNEWVSGYYEDVEMGNSYDYDGTTLTKVNAAYTISLFDYDELDLDDAMSGIIFIPTDHLMNFPSSITLSNSETTIILEVKWGF